MLSYTVSAIAVIKLQKISQCTRLRDRHNLKSSVWNSRYDQSSWFFKKVSPPRSPLPVCCLAPGRFDRLILVNCHQGIVDAVKRVIVSQWSPGILNEFKSESEPIFTFTFNGNPWLSDGKETVECRKVKDLIQSNMK